MRTYCFRLVALGMLVAAFGPLFVTAVQPTQPAALAQNTFTEFPLPVVFIGPNSAPPRLISITEGPDGNIWFTMESRDTSGNFIDHVGRMTTTGQTTVFQVPASANAPSYLVGQIVAGPDGALWFAADDQLHSVAGSRLDMPQRLGRVTTDGTFTFFDPLFTTGPCSGTFDGFVSAIIAMAGAPDGIWFTHDCFTTGGASPRFLGRMTTSGVFTDFLLPSDITTFPTGITVGPDGNIWLAGHDNIIVRVTPAGGMTEFPLSDNQPFNPPMRFITTGPDGNLWFTPALGTSGGTVFAASVGRITTAGDITRFYIFNNKPTEMVAGPDGALWAVATACEFERIPAAPPPPGQIGAADLFFVGSGCLGGNMNGSLALGSDNAIWVGETTASFFATRSVPDLIGRMTVASASGTATPTPTTTASVTATGTSTMGGTATATATTTPTATQTPTTTVGTTSTLTTTATPMVCAVGPKQSCPASVTPAATASPSPATATATSTVCPVAKAGCGSSSGTATAIVTETSVGLTSTPVTPTATRCVGIKGGSCAPPASATATLTSTAVAPTTTPTPCSVKLGCPGAAVSTRANGEGALAESGGLVLPRVVYEVTVSSPVMPTSRWPGRVQTTA